jgi:hypothetical protein
LRLFVSVCLCLHHDLGQRIFPGVVSAGGAQAHLSTHFCFGPFCDASDHKLKCLSPVSCPPLLFVSLPTFLLQYCWVRIFWLVCYGERAHCARSAQSTLWVAKMTVEC